jgi:tetratricopeptide (TPR) repeat protein
MNKAEALRAAFDLPKATEAFEAWSQDWPLFLLARGRFDEALAAAKAMTGGRWASARALGHAAAASALAAMDRKDEARAELTAAEEQVPHISNKGTYVARPEMVRPYLDVVQGEIMLRSGQRQDGGERLKAVQRTLRGIYGADAWILALFRLERIGAIARDAGDWDLAEYTAGQMREHDPEYAGTHFALGWSPIIARIATLPVESSARPQALESGRYGLADDQDTPVRGQLAHGP